MALQRIFDEVWPHDTCPIFPFPSADPKHSDRLAAAYRAELEGAWSVDTRNLIFAHEDDPLDLYRTILRIEEERKPAFKQFGGSMLVLSPLGSRMLSIGSLMAAFGSRYVEARSHEVDWNATDKILPAEPTVRHVWLAGEVYPSMSRS